MRETAYNTLVRPQLQYVGTIWDPYTKEKTLQLEKIQRSKHAGRPVITITGQALHLCLTNSVGEPFSKDGLMPAFVSSTRWSLELWQYPSQITSSLHIVSRYCHSMTFRQIHTNRNYYKYSFFPLAFVQLNALPESVVSLQDLEAFKVPVSKPVRRITENHTFTEKHRKPPKTTWKIIFIGELYPPSICFLVVYVYN